MAFADDWPADAAMSPFELVDWQRACGALNCSGNTLLRLLAEHDSGVVRLSKRKRCVIARDLLRIVQARTRPADTYAAVAHG